MRTISVRDISGAVITEATARQETLGITNNNVLAGVLVPVTSRWVEHMVDLNMSRILHGLQRGEKEISNKELLATLDDSLLEQADYARNLPIRHVSIRDVSGALIEEAADRKELLGITNNRVLTGVLVPMTRALVDQLVELNISRVLHSISRGEGEIASKASLDTLDDVLRDA
jgi:hypothetical protein